MIDNFNETDCVIDLLLQQGIAVSRISVLGNVSRTIDELIEFNKYLSWYDHQSVLMVTSSYHMRRAVAIAKRQKISLDYYSTGKISHYPIFDDFIISVSWLKKIKHLFYEVVAYSSYLVTGRL